MATMTTNRADIFDTTEVPVALISMEKTLTEGIREIAAKFSNALELNPRVFVHQHIEVKDDGESVGNDLTITLDTIPVRDWDIEGQVALTILHGSLEHIASTLGG